MRYDATKDYDVIGNAAKLQKAIINNTQIDNIVGIPWVTFYESVIRVIYVLLITTGRKSFRYRLALWILDPNAKFLDLFKRK